ncbi:hypothetical protein [Streptomyces sp. CAU 1734]|uniref:hypothetical protein n=1 Tax=Streptomyces sp. CAU 1734 TaxID=3140360 RepID=UPI003260BC90
MRPGRFQEFVIGLAESSGAATGARLLTEAGGAVVPCGVAIGTGGEESEWGILGQLPDGAKHDGFDDTPVHGEPVAPGDGPRTGDEPEAWLAALLARAQSPEIAGVERWSVREDMRPGYAGVTVRFHNSARVFVRLL